MSSHIHLSIPRPAQGTQFTANALQNDPKIQVDARVRIANDARRGYANDACVPQLVAVRGAVAPNETALVAAGEEVTYGELERRSNQLAHYLISLGVGRGTIVAVCLGRSVQTVVWSLGILKAGGAYLPLDPAYPLE